MNETKNEFLVPTRSIVRLCPIIRIPSDTSTFLYLNLIVDIFKKKKKTFVENVIL